MLFGSDWPGNTPDRWLADFAKLDIREEIRPKVLKANARRLRATGLVYPAPMRNRGPDMCLKECKGRELAHLSFFGCIPTE